MEKRTKQMFSYEKWWRLLFRTTLMVAGIVAVTEIICFLIITYYDLPMLSGLSDFEYFTRYLLVPVLLFIITLTINKVIISRSSFSETVKNYTAVLSFSAICVITEIIHDQYPPLLCAPCVAIFLSVIFGDKKLLLSCTLISYISLFTVLMFKISAGISGDDLHLIVFNVAIAAIIIACSYVASRTIHGYIVSQQTQMKNDYDKQTKLIEELEIDPLTQLYNRRYLGNYLDGAFAYCKDNNGKMYIAMADIDDFKKINDTYGHEVGDYILSLLGEIIRNNAMGKYRGFRYGGEEFALLFSHDDKKRVVDTLEKIREDFLHYSEKAGKKIPATISIGYAGFSKTYDSPAVWLGNADKALYKAKRNGKNQSVHYTAELENEHFRMTDRIKCDDD